MNIGDVVNDRYEIIALIKNGGMGAVYKINDKRLEKICVLKMLLINSNDLSEREEIEKSFEREAKILGKIDHVRLPSVTDYFKSNGNNFLVMEFVDGLDLEEMLQKKDFTDQEVVDIGIQICEVLEYLHNQSPPIIYRDMKPSNIMMNDNKQVKLIDFGIARKIVDGINTKKLENKQTIIGTPGFSPLEQYYGKADVRSDIYALGMTLYYLLTKVKPEDIMSVRSVEKIRPQTHKELASVIKKATDTRLDERYQDMFQMKKDLENIFRVKRDGQKLLLVRNDLDVCQKIIDDIYSFLEDKSSDDFYFKRICQIRKYFSFEETKEIAKKQLLSLLSDMQEKNNLFEIAHWSKIEYMVSEFKQKGRYKESLKLLESKEDTDQPDWVYFTINNLVLLRKEQVAKKWKKSFEVFSWIFYPLSIILFQKFYLGGMSVYNYAFGMVFLAILKSTGVLNWVDIKFKLKSTISYLDIVMWALMFVVFYLIFK